jgi:hypothetical protein
MGTSDAYPDLPGDALSSSSQRLAQLASLVTAAATVEARRRAQRNAAKIIRSEQARRDLHDQERAACQLARAGWAPAHDARWLARAGLLQAARAWCAATAYADADPEAAAAARTCEQRLRVLHPYAMARYDRLRSEGAGPVDAMREAVPLFGRAPHARPGDPAPGRRSLAAPDSADADRDDTGTGAAAVVQAGPGSAAARQAGQRGLQIVRELQERALAERGYPLSADELVTTLGATTTLPSDVIARLARADREDHVAAAAERDRADDLGNAPVVPSPRGGVMHGEYLTAAARDRLEADTAAAHADGDRSAAQLAAESFPCTAAGAVTAAARTGPADARVNATLNLRRPGRSV